MLKNTFSRVIWLLTLTLIALSLLTFSGCGSPTEDTTLVETVSDTVSETSNDIESQTDAGESPSESETDGNTDFQNAVTSADDVALYINKHGELPPNYITTKEAASLGWLPSENNLWDVAPGMSIGGDIYENYGFSLPHSSSRIWYECDINYDGEERGAEKLIYSNDGLFYYTSDGGITFEEISVK